MVDSYLAEPAACHCHEPPAAQLQADLVEAPILSRSDGLASCLCQRRITATIIYY